MKIDQLFKQKPSAGFHIPPDDIAKIAADYCASAERLEPFTEKIEPVFIGLTETERTCMQFCLTYMPLQDLISVDFDIILACIRHTIQLAEQVESVRNLPTGIFMSFLLFYRVNNENIEFNRAFFYNELSPRINGKSVREAILEVNYWCAEHVTYRATDERTASPLTTIRRGFGRCGEESTLLVSALRAVGIPARQIYTPRWSHCDDNHAWVEAYADGEWFYLGACEPEPRLDKGWFTAAASKAMLIHAKAFGADFPNETVTSQSEVSALINRTAKYAKTSHVTIRVLADGEPVANATVNFEIVNYSELFPLLTLTADGDGTARAELGRGTLHITAIIPAQDKSGQARVGFATVHATQNTTVTIKVEAPNQAKAFTFSQHPPMEAVSHAKKDNCLIMDHDARLQYCTDQRALFESNLQNDKRIAAFRESPFYDPRYETFLANARDNVDELIQFLSGNQYSNDTKCELLETLREKDFVDISADTLHDTLQTALLVQSLYKPEIYRQAVLPIRIANEMLRPDRESTLHYYQERTVPLNSAQTLYESWKNQIRPETRGTYADLVASVPGMLKFKIGDPRSMDIGFVLAARALGYPADLDPVTGVPRTLVDGNMTLVCTSEPCSGQDTVQRVTIINKSRSPLIYWKNWTMQRFDGVQFRTLNYDNLQIAKDTRLMVKPGFYRFVTSYRQIDGSVKVTIEFLTVSANTSQCVELTIPTGDDLTTLFHNAPLPRIERGNNPANFSSKTPNGEILAFVGIGDEPTEHFLNELLEAKDELNRRKVPICLIHRQDDNLTDTTLMKVRAKIHYVILMGDDDLEATITLMRQRMKVGDERLPFMIAVGADGKGLYAFANYNVGAVNLLLQILDAAATKAPVPAQDKHLNS